MTRCSPGKRDCTVFDSMHFFNVVDVIQGGQRLVEGIVFMVEKTAVEVSEENELQSFLRNKSPVGYGSLQFQEPADLPPVQTL